MTLNLSPQEAEQFTEALRLDPNDPDTHYNLGFIFIQLGRPEEAVPQLTEAVRLKPDFEEALQHLRLCEEKASSETQ